LSSTIRGPQTQHKKEDRKEDEIVEEDDNTEVLEVVIDPVSFQKECRLQHVFNVSNRLTRIGSV
jgi:hypothetical protein